MRRKTHIMILYCFIGLLLGGCIHEYPEEIAEVKEVNLDVELLPDREFIPLPAITKAGDGGNSIVPEGYLPRVVIEARREGESNPAVRAIMTVSEQELADERINLPVTLNLKSVPYRLTVWVDYVKDASLLDRHYNTESLSAVSHILPYEEDHTHREAFYGNLDVNLSGQEGNVSTQVDVKRPLAHYRVVATDVREFLSKQQANGRPGTGEYEVLVTYQYFLVTRINAITGEPTDSGTGFGYTRKISITPDMEELELGADYVFAGEKDSGVTITVEVNDDGGNNVSRKANIEIPYRRGCTTTVKGALLTAKDGSGGGESGSGGIDIGFDNDYEGEINIDAGGKADQTGNDK